MSVGTFRRYGAVVLGLSWAVGSTGCGDASSRGGGHAARDSVLVALEAYYRDLSARDWPAFASHFWPGADLTTLWQPPGEQGLRVVPTPVPQFIAQAPEGPGSRAIFEERMLESQVRVTGDLAQAWVRYRARFGDPGAVEEWEGIDAISLLRVDGRWRIASLVYAPEAR